MSSNNKEHREYINRQNRSFALYLSIQCWIQNIDGIKISHENIKQFSGLERLDSSRKKWLIEDFKAFFSFAEEKEDIIMFSRQEIKEEDMGWIDITNDYLEAQVSVYLALLSQGLIQPTINKDFLKLPIVHPPIPPFDIDISILDF